MRIVSDSYSQKIKDQIESLEVRKKCCIHTEEDFALIDFGIDSSEQIMTVWNKCRCDGCHAVFLRHLFLTCGSVTNPDKAYHLDFAFRFSSLQDTCKLILAEAGFEFHPTIRRSRYILYVKNSTTIEDFLITIGASSAAFELMNQKIVRDVSNIANRQVNCDTANIEKQLASAKKYLDAIQYLIDSGHIEQLPDDLKETAYLRLENKQLSLVDLGALHNIPVSKSGVRHRLSKIFETAEKFKTES